MLTPCIDCTDRVPGCHSTCDAYAKWRGSYDKIVAEQRKRYNDDATGVLVDYAKRSQKERTRRK